MNLQHDTSSSPQIPALFHEISQPLTAVRCSLEVSLLPGSNQTNQRRCLEQALQQTDRIIHLIETLRRLLDA